jgi:uncharacterized membrane protein YkvA (DUF1232 family)
LFEFQSNLIFFTQNMTNLSKPPKRQHWKAHTRQLKQEIYALYLVYRDPRTPWLARLMAALVVGYAFSPIDLIPDPIPILGYLDDLVLVPLGIWITLKLIPPDVMAECRLQAQTILKHDQTLGRWGAILVVGMWVILLVGLIFWVAKYF